MFLASAFLRTVSPLKILKSTKPEVLLNLENIKEPLASYPTGGSDILEILKEIGNQMVFDF